MNPPTGYRENHFQKGTSSWGDRQLAQLIELKPLSAHSVAVQHQKEPRKYFQLLILPGFERLRPSRKSRSAMVWRASSPCACNISGYRPSPSRVNRAGSKHASAVAIGQLADQGVPMCCVEAIVAFARNNFFSSPSPFIIRSF